MVFLAIEVQANVLPGRLIRPDWSGYYCHNVCIATMKYNSMFLQIGPTKHYALVTRDHSIELMHVLSEGRNSRQLYKTNCQRQIPIHALFISVLKCFDIQETDLDYYKIEGNRNLGAVFMHMLKVYIACLEDRDLPNYFIR